MNNDNFEQSLSTLFKRRKAALDVPEISLSSTQAGNKSKRLWMRLLSIFSIAGGMSFGVFAVITYLLPAEQQSQQATYHHTPVLLEDSSANTSEKPTFQVVDIPPLPPEPKSARSDLPPMPATLPEIPAVEFTLNTSKPSVVIPTQNTDSINQVSMPAILPDLVNKVMPEYPIEAVQKGLEGEVVLSYQIAESGSVENIELLSTDAPHVLVKSAKRALGQWQFAHGAQVNGKVNGEKVSGNKISSEKIYAEPIAVSFEFTLPKK